MINAHFDKPYVKTIRLKLAKQTEQRIKKKQQQKKVTSHEPVEITKKHQEALDQVKDEQLQKILQDFLHYCK
jgi:hypothetical protein